MRMIVGALMAAAALAGGGARAEPAKVTVATESGVVAGRAEGPATVFKGIPYAAAPVGPLRWAPPAAAPAWKGERDAGQFGPICPQVGNYTGPQSEDCLTLNVWAPVAAKRAPVMVWIHGGANRNGTGSAAIYDGAGFARDGVILVSINYRIGPLGYFAHPSVTAGARPGEPLGDYGIMDQIAALKWVQRNIARFGGDTANVTVFGESAGGTSTLVLLASPQAKGLFAKAIAESSFGWNQFRPLARAEADGAAIATRLGLPGAQATLEQLRAVPAATLAALPVPVAMIVDGRVMPEPPSQAFAKGRAADVPFILGSNSYEASVMRQLGATPAAVLRLVPPETRALYAAEAKTDDALAEAIYTDAQLGAPATWIAARAAGGAPVFLYQFAYVAEGLRAKAPGAGHGSEIGYVFDTLAGAGQRQGFAPTARDQDMARLMHGCWVSFAKTGAPACAGVAWPAYDPAKDVLLAFGDRTGPVARFRDAQYKAVEAISGPPAH